MLPFIDDAKTAILEAIKNMGTDLKPTIDGIKTNFDEWKVPWTVERAGKIDNLDVQVSTRSTQASVDALTSKVTELDADVGETADTGGGVNTGTTMAKLNTLLGRGGVKRITRGYIAWNHTGWTEVRSGAESEYSQVHTQVSIPAVDVSKSVVLVDVVNYQYGALVPTYAVAFLSNTNTLEIRMSGRVSIANRSEVNYQVIEFY